MGNANTVLDALHLPIHVPVWQYDFSRAANINMASDSHLLYIALFLLV